MQHTGDKLWTIKVVVHDSNSLQRDYHRYAVVAFPMVAVAFIRDHLFGKRGGIISIMVIRVEISRVKRITVRRLSDCWPNAIRYITISRRCRLTTCEARGNPVKSKNRAPRVVSRDLEGDKKKRNEEGISSERTVKSDASIIVRR